MGILHNRSLLSSNDKECQDTEPTHWRAGTQWSEWVPEVRRPPTLPDLPGSSGESVRTVDTTERREEGRQRVGGPPSRQSRAVVPKNSGSWPLEYRSEGHVRQ